MSDHLPECDSAFTDLHTANCVCRCICPELRACEQRVEEAMDRSWTHTLRIKQSEAFANGVAAAREAVAATRGWFTYDYPDDVDASDALPVVLLDDALAAIDGLKP